LEDQALRLSLLKEKGAMQAVHQWFVKQGRLGVSSDDAYIFLEVDPEGASECLLTPRDGSEVATVLTQHARTIWEKSDHSAPFTPSLEVLSESAYRWQAAAGDLTLSVPSDSLDLAVRYAGSGQCQLTMAQTVEIVQMIERLLDQILVKSSDRELG